jgi:hypothetical protein
LAWFEIISQTKSASTAKSRTVITTVKTGNIFYILNKQL